MLFRQSIDASRNYPLNHFYLAAALAHLGRQSEAEAEMKAGLGDCAELHHSRASAPAPRATIQSISPSANA